ncbi:MAG TPA: hypothetical protein VF514_11840 [Bacteroidota bacterium]
MSIFSYMVVSLLLVAAAMCIILLVERSRRKAIEKAKAERIREANRPLKVWICRYCGFMSLMRNEVCSGCGSPRQEEFIYRTILGKEFAAQIRVGAGGGEDGKEYVEGSPDRDCPAEIPEVHPAHHPGR